MDVTRSSHIILNKWHTFSIYVIWNWSSWILSAKWMMDAFYSCTQDSAEQKRRDDNPQMRVVFVTWFLCGDKMCRCVFFIFAFSFFSIIFYFFISNECCSFSRNVLWGPLCALCQQSHRRHLMSSVVSCFSRYRYVDAFDMKSSDSKH